mgnify:CR=1 FL=1
MAAGAQLNPDGPPAGWYPDPLGRFGWRWWDGVRWTAGVGADGRIEEDPLPSERRSRRSRVATAVVFLVAVALVAAGAVALVRWLGDRETHVNTLGVQTVVRQLDAAGMPCEAQGRPLSGAGGMPFPGDADYFEFGSCRLANGELLAIVTFHPDARPDRPPCQRAQRIVSPSGAWWIHQQSDEVASGGLSRPQTPDAATLRAVATALGGRYVDTC